MISQVLTLYITPVVYLYLEKCQEYFVALPARLRASRGARTDRAPAAPQMGIESASEKLR
jgi:hypothetical protein